MEKTGHQYGKPFTPPFAGDDATAARARIDKICAMVLGTEMLLIGSQEEAVSLLAAAGKRVTAIDRDAPRSSGAETIRADFLQHDFGNRRFDSVVTTDTLEYTLFPGEWIAKAFSLLREGGVFAAAVPFGLSPRRGVKNTYFLHDVLDLVLPQGPVEDYGVLDARYVYVKAVKKRDYDGMLLDMRDVLGKSGEAFLEKEKAFYEKQELLGEIKTLRAEILSAEKFREALRASKEQEEIREKRIALLEKELAEVKRFNEKLVRSGTYQLAQRIAKIKKNPLYIFLTPVWAAKYFFRRLKSRVGGLQEQAGIAAPKAHFPGITMATLMDDATYAAFRHECRMVRITRDRFKSELKHEKIDFLFIQSAPACFPAPKRLRRRIPSEDLARLAKAAQSQGIPAVLWETEQVFRLEDIAETAKMFQCIFTTSGENVDKYRQLGFEAVYPLPCGVQPQIFTPAREGEDRKNRVLMLAENPAEGADPSAAMEALGQAALPYGLDICLKKDSAVKVPESLKAYVKRFTHEKQIEALYKEYPLVIHIPSGAGTLPKRALEIMACGACLLTPPSAELEKDFKGATLFAKDEPEATRLVAKVMEGGDFADKRRLLALRAVCRGHTYRRRFMEMGKKVGLKLKRAMPGVSVVVATNRPGFMDLVIGNFCRQDYAKKELIVVLNKDDMDSAVWERKAEECGGALTIVSLPEGAPLGECLNAGFERAKYPVVAKFDDDDYYAPAYLSDMLMYFECTQADIVGKYAYYVYFESIGTLAVKHPGAEQAYQGLVSGATLVMKKSVLKRVKFDGALKGGEDTDFLKKAAKKGFKIYSCDRFNFAAVRRRDGSSHTYKLSDEEHLKMCKIVGMISDYERFVTV